MSQAKSWIRQWAESGRLLPEHVPAALTDAGLTPRGDSWRQFIAYLLLANGGMLLMAGIAFFFAANWDVFGRFAKFGLIEAGMAGCLLVYGLKPDTRLGQASLTGAAMLLGVLLAYFGQTYQTGADNWQLFAVWAAMITPWAVLARNASLWVLWLLLVNVALPLYFMVRPGLVGVLSAGDALLWCLVLFNGTALAAWEGGSGRVAWLPRLPVARALGAQTGLCLTWLAIQHTADPHGAVSAGVLAVYAGVLPLLYRIYRRVRYDLFMLAGLCFSLMTVLTVALGKWLFAGDGLLAFLAMAVWLVFASAVSVRWLRAVQGEQGHD